MQPHLFKITLDVLPDLTKENLHDLGIDVIRDILATNFQQHNCLMFQLK